MYRRTSKRGNETRTAIRPIHEEHLSLRRYGIIVNLVGGRSQTRIFPDHPRSRIEVKLFVGRE